MARVSAQVILRTTDNIAANFATNTFHFDIDEDPGLDNDKERICDEEITPAIAALYDSFRASTLGGLQIGGHRIKYVDIDDPAPQYPFVESVWDFPSGVAQVLLPSEVCIASSFEGVRVAGVNQASKRGRLFLGPLNVNANDNGRVDAAARTAIANGFKAFKDSTDDAGFSGWIWTVYSRKLDIMTPVVMGHVDNAFDTQRRRGVSSTARTVWEG